MKIKHFTKHKNEMIYSYLKSLSKRAYVFIQDKEGIEVEYLFNFTHRNVRYSDFIYKNDTTVSHKVIIYIFNNIYFEDGYIKYGFIQSDIYDHTFKSIMEQHHINIRNENFDKLLDEI